MKYQTLEVLKEVQKIFSEMHTRCFWYMRSDVKLTVEHIPIILGGLRLHGGHKGYQRARDIEQWLEQCR